jgi:DNA-binding transcriptional ArsR family regulator
MSALVEQTVEGTRPRLSWDLGTAYDLMMSLEVLHSPENFGLRASWAAGVRSRVPADERGVLEDSLKLFYVPLSWVHDLPAPKDSATALWSLSQLPPSERLEALGMFGESSSEYKQVLQNVSDRRAWDDKDLELLRSSSKAKKGHSKKDLTTVLEWWSRPDEFGEMYLKALQSYYQEFFAEEERRIKPALQRSMEQAQELAEITPLLELIETLSQGVKIAIEPDVSELIFAPSYWITPLILYNKIDQQRMVFIYGARPAEASLVPGEVVPDALLRALKALADPTRLKIIRYLSEEPLAPAQLSRRLRLRPPTVIHHLEVLRLAGLVLLNLEIKGERKYAARIEGIEDACANIKEFLQADLTG